MYLLILQIFLVGFNLIKPLATPLITFLMMIFSTITQSGIYNIPYLFYQRQTFSIFFTNLKNSKMIFGLVSSDKNSFLE